MSAGQAHVVLISIKVIAVYKKEILEATKPFTPGVDICEQVVILHSNSRQL